MDDVDVVRSLTALAQPVRLKVFRTLVVTGQADVTPSAMAEGLGIPPNTLTFHLKERANAGLVTQERASRNIIYRAADERMNDLLGYLTNFAVSTRGANPGADHLGIQTDSEEDLQQLKLRAQAADMALLDEGATTCRCVRSDKCWLTDPQGIAWEQFHTLGDIPLVTERHPLADSQPSSCC